MTEISPNFQEQLENAIKETFVILREIYKGSSSNTRLIFPTYKHCKDTENPLKRVSEQEFRFVFIEQIREVLTDNDLYYSIETPTEKKYRFSKDKKPQQPEVDDENGQSAAFDLTIKTSKGENVAIIEFKAHSADKHEIAKDFCKLLNKEEKADHRYFINLFEKIDSGTYDTLLSKMSKDNNKYWPDGEKRFSESVNVFVGSLSCCDKDKKYIVSINKYEQVNMPFCY